MNYNNRVENDSTMTMRVVCAVAFVTLSFLFLYFRQADVMTVAQHVLSDGQTVYSPFIGSLLITALLYALQRGLNSVLKINRRLHWLTFFPSILLLTVVTDISSDIDLHFSFGAWLWLFPLLLVAWCILAWLVSKVQNYEADISSRGFFSRLVWVNLFPLGFMMMLCGIIASSEDTFHYRAKIERLMVEGDFEQAALVGEKSMSSDSSLTMLRCYALAREGRMPDEMFKYAVCGTSQTILPSASESRMMLYPVDSLYRFLGAKPLPGMKPKQYLRSLEASGYESKAISDYILCGMLVDRNLDGFVKELPRHYAVNDSLPLHYREALVLYTHRRANPLIVYHNQVMDTDFDDLQKLEDESRKPAARALAVYEQYSGTYWWYYDYGK